MSVKSILQACFACLFITATNPAIGAEEVFDANRNFPGFFSTVDGEPSLEPHANFGAFEGGVTGTKKDTQTNLQIPKDTQLGGGGFNIPTGAPPSPLTINGKTARAWEQPLLRLEEFGTEALPVPVNTTDYNGVNTKIFPRPVGSSQTANGDWLRLGLDGEALSRAQTGPNWNELDTFLESPIFPYPTEAANTSDLNPWQSDIENFVGSIGNPPAEGRPPGSKWSHQRYDEFYPRKYVQTAQAGARDNSGMRDNRQRHGYALGEFGPGGLYHNTIGGGSQFDGTTAGIGVRFHPNLPIQHENTVFTFDGTFPPKLLSVRYGEPVLFRHYNALPIDPAANNGFGLHTLSTHEHNGHTPAESDGYTNAFFFPGQFFDYRWPIQLAGYDNSYDGGNDGFVNGANPKAAYPCTAGEQLPVSGTIKDCVVGADGVNGTIKIPGDYRETMSTHWFHDHMLDFTAPNVYKGNVAMMNYYSAIDRGNESIDDGVNLKLPSGSALSWGNRDYDVNLLIAAKAWDNNGQLFFNPFNTDGFLGDRMTVNWLFKPYMDVRARKYRFRLLNASISRYLKIAIVARDPGSSSYEPVQFHMIANDGNIMEHSLKFSNGILPTQSIAERYDIIINFADYIGKEVFMVNLMEHKNGRGPEKDAVPLSSVLSGSYNAQIIDNEWKGGDPVIGKFMRFNVVDAAPYPDSSMNPAAYEEGGLSMIPRPTFTQAELDNATHRSFDFGRSSGTDDAPWTVKTDGGAGYNMDPRRLSAAPNIGDVEIWHMKTGGGWSHPIHVHFEEGQILHRDGMKPPKWETLARKDVYRIGPEVDSSRELSIAIRFREFGGTYMEHCHNTQHEDTAMLLRWDIETGDPTLLPTPMPTWAGVTFTDSFALATYKTGDLDAKSEGVNIPEADANGGDVNNDGVIDRIFGDADLRLMSPPAMEPNQVPDMSHILSGYIKDESMAVALGKAFFWDQSVGSDGLACASCHFSAGADNRTKNQLKLTDNYQLTESDYPFPKDFDDVAGSQGAIDAIWDPSVPVSSRELRKMNSVGTDLCSIDNSLHYRQRTERNTPSVINAIFNHRNFWDGRANNMFNGHDPFGARGSTAGIWMTDGDPATVDSPAETAIELIKNASLASQAVEPANSTAEMACSGRTFPLLGRKMLERTALSRQTIAGSDSVLGPLKKSRGRGLSKQYKEMIGLAFQDKYVSDAVVVPGEDNFTQTEANFALFWGLAIQMYEATLISGETPFDEFARGNDLALTEQQKLGLEVFMREDRASCSSCHTGSAFSNATVAARALAPDGGMVEVLGEPQEPPEAFERMRMGDDNVSLYDGGFYNIGVSQTDKDLCVGANGVDGLPLSFSRQAVMGIIVDAEADQPAAGGEDEFPVQGGTAIPGESTVGVDGACKTPSLRNVELTAPYYHNGSHATLEQAMIPYMLKFKNLWSTENLKNLAPEILEVDIGGLAFDGVSTRGGEFEAIIAFMKSLTDERVRYHRAPFDHPSLVIPDGSTGVDSNNDGRADDILKTIPAVGAGGYATPLTLFADALPPQ